MTETDRLTRILYLLQENRQRATYGAVASYLGRNAWTLMNGRPRDPLHSWVVSKEDGQPTKYREDQKHPDLEQDAYVVRTESELRDFIAANGGLPRSKADVDSSKG